MNDQRVILELLGSACSSIRLRLREEVLEETIPAAEAHSLQEQILQGAAVKEVLEKQDADGWIGKVFHGYESHEAGIRLLSEKGLTCEAPVLRHALEALEDDAGRAGRELGTVGRVLDEGGFGGAEMMQAALFACAGMESKPSVQAQIRVALEVLEGLQKFTALEEIAEAYKGKLVFKKGLCWAGIYHLRLLAFTHSWRSPDILEIVTNAVRKLIRFSPIPYIGVRHGSQLIAPPSFAMQDFKPDLSSLSLADWMPWFHRMECLARLGVVRMIPELQDQVDGLCQLLEEGQGWFGEDVSHTYFKHWGSYTGLMLEEDWKSPRRRMYDLTFRSLLILKYSRA